MTYPILHVERGIERGMVMSTIADCLPSWVEKYPRFSVFQMRNNSDLLDWKHKKDTDLVGVLAWYDEKKSDPCMSDPSGKIHGAFLVTDDWIVHHQYGLTLNELDHNYSRVPNQFYTTAGLGEILKGFKTVFLESDERFYIKNGPFLPKQRARKTTLARILSKEKVK